MNDAIKRMIQKYKVSTHAETERAIKEILQEITLIGLWRGKFFEHAAFYGGTALRILYDLDRFSEDLDFTLLDPKKEFTWGVFEKNVKDELLSYGFDVTFSEKKKSAETDVQSAFLKTNTLHALLQIGIKDLYSNQFHPDALIKVKVEIDSNPCLGFETESVYLKEPLPVSIRALKESSLFAGKAHAAIYRAWKNRVKGRDWYDLIWFLRRNIPLNLQYFESCMLSGDKPAKRESLTEDSLKNLLKTRLKEINLKAAKDDVVPFLKDPSQLDVWSVDFFSHWIDQLKILEK